MIELSKEEYEVLEASERELLRSERPKELVEVLEKIRAYDKPITVEALPPPDESKYSGFYGLERRRPGDRFRILNGRAYSYKWMRIVPDNVDLTVGPRKKNRQGQYTGPERVGPSGLSMIDRDEMYNAVEAAKQQARQEILEAQQQVEESQDKAGYTPPGKGKQSNRKVL